MTLRVIIGLLLMFTTSACRVVSAGSGQGGARVVNVREFGARGDGVADDTAPIQAAVNAAKPGETIYFPAGVYSVSNFVVKNRSGLSFAGEGQKSTIKQRTGAARIATVEASRDIVISNLAFDANGIVSYGGVVFYATKGVRIENDTFVDSASKPIGKTDRYSFVFARGSEPSQDIKIVNNVIDDLQLEVNHSQRVVIDRNTVKRAIATAGIGIFTVGDKAIAEDYQITNNTVIDPSGAGISVGIDPPKDKDCTFRRITISGNQIIRTNTSGYGIRIGTPDSSIKTTGNVFQDIEIKNNRLRIENTAPKPVQVIFANSSPQAGIIFRAFELSGNKIEIAGLPNKGYAIDLRRIQKSMISDNVVTGSANGIFLGGDLLSNEVRNNVVEAMDIAFMLEGSLGENTAANNRTVGNPRQIWKVSNLQKSDSVER